MIEAQNKVIRKFVEDNYSPMFVNPGKCRYNFMYHANSVHEAIKEGYNEIAMCIYFDGSCPIIHFVNIDDAGAFIDNTLGHWSSQYDFYMVKRISKDDFWFIFDIYKEFRKELSSQIPWYLRIFKTYQA